MLRLIINVLLFYDFIENTMRGGGGGERRRSRGSYFPYILLNENPSERNPNNVFTTGKAISNGVASGVVH